MDGPMTSQTVWNVVAKYAEQIEVTVVPNDLRQCAMRRAELKLQ